MVLKKTKIFNLKTNYAIQTKISEPLRKKYVKKIHN